MIAVGWALAALTATCWAINRLDDRLDRRQQERAAVAEAEQYTRDAAEQAHTEGDQT